MPDVIKADAAMNESEVHLLPIEEPSLEVVSRKQKSAAIEAAQIGLFEWSVEKDRFVWLQLPRGLFGRTSTDFGGDYAALDRQVHPEDRSELKTKILQSIKIDGNLSHEFRVLWPDETEHWLEVRAGVVKSDSGQNRLIGAMLDITARKASEISLRLREAELSHLGRVATMAQMASGLAHEMTQPLGAILNYAGVCMTQLEHQRERTPGVIEPLQEIISETRRAGVICSRMRMFVRKHWPVCVPVNVNTLVLESLTMMNWELRARAIETRMDLHDDLPLVSGDASQIVQVLTHLITNSAEAMAGQSPAKLLLQTCPAEDVSHVRISVIDSGIGLSPEHFRRLFEPFFTTKADGLGMGLNICRSIIENMGGRLTGSMNPAGQVGMRFGFALPVHTEHSQ